MSKSHVLLGSVGVVLAALIVGCATDGAEKHSEGCGATDYRCLSRLSNKYRAQAQELEATARRYEVDADAQLARDPQDTSGQAKRNRDLAKQMRMQAKEADQHAQELRHQLPHNVVGGDE